MDRKVELNIGDTIETAPGTRLKYVMKAYHVTYCFRFIDSYDIDQAEVNLSPIARRILYALLRRIDSTRGHIVVTCVENLEEWTHLSTINVYDGVAILKKHNFIQKGKRLGKKSYEIIINPYWYWRGNMRSKELDLIEERKKWDLLLKGVK